ncbi:Putative zinc-finger [Jatrophihabitans endophyticus]|uniref:Putative zinc-finger n=1 Tax=Jatrophihabitans endophyticus TaxID=1206085 RepID=A0A1M5CLG2_9ACTN|nr:zf-HC2 domain-containing protein [Jatrophihabitans endophyticus]SHF55625.1 Putative zinc-finger [Jatrophihabitans endophyticus]
MSAEHSEESPDRYARHDAAYALGSLDPGEREAFEGHLRSCPACAARTRDARALVRLLDRTIGRFR